MPFSHGKVYGVLRVKVKVDEGEFTSHRSGMSHYNLICEDEESKLEYQVNIDIQSSSSPNVRMLVIDDFDVSSAFTTPFSDIPSGFKTLECKPGGLAIDLIHHPIFKVDELKDAQPLSASQISTQLKPHLSVGTEIIVFGTRYEDSDHKFHHHYHHSNESYRDAHLYGVRRHREQNLPPRGVDDVHLNQGTPDTQYQHVDNGCYQDGALFIANGEGKYTAVFFAFEAQCFDTDNSGNCKKGKAKNKDKQVAVDLAETV